MLSAGLALPAQAGPWVQKKGQGLVIVGVTGYRAEERFTVDGQRRPLGPDGRFRSLSPHIWAEIGLTDGWTGILSFGVPSQHYQQAGYRAASTAPGDLYAGFRRAVRRPDAGWQVSLQVLVKAPTYSGGTQPRPGNGQADLEGSVLAGRSFPLRSRWAFISAEGGYRARWGRPADQWRSELAMGLHVNSKLTLVGQSFVIRSLGAFPRMEPGMNPLIEPHFHLTKVQGSAVVRFRPSWRVQGGHGWDLAGRNVGRGRLWLIAIWKIF